MRSPAVPLALLLTALGAPVAAQFAPGPTAPRDPRLPGPSIIRDVRPSPGVWRDLRDIRDRIESGRDAGTLSKREARALRREARQIESLGERYGRDGLLSESELKELDARALYLRDAVGAARAR